MSFAAAAHVSQDPAETTSVRNAPGSTIPRRAVALRRGRALAVAAVAALATTACLGPAGGARVGQADASGDGTLRIGLILDNTGAQS